jgi:clan AA aspartic protease (TIGR02281 family)
MDLPMLHAAILWSLLVPSIPCTNAGSPGCVVEVRVAGSAIPLQVDSGADITMLSAKAARRAGIRWDASSPMIVMSGVAGRTAAVLARVKVEVGGDKEESVLIAIAPVNLGRAEGLLGMSFLERFRWSLDRGELKLTPIDQGENPRPGGRGRSWWSLRFQQTARRLETYQRAVSAAKELDKQAESEIGVDPSGIDTQELMKRLKRMGEEEIEDLNNSAARASVPLEWRR